MKFKWEHDHSHESVDLFIDHIASNTCIGWAHKTVRGTAQGYKVYVLSDYRQHVPHDLLLGQFVTIREAMRRLRVIANLLVIGGHYGF
ncbi:hypothetical protein UFOVP48_18 [uncultured Caudovirales phage]|uniref:Uncharacterized protein n=1 Tax=uncultured Caudovirales phage TaxID=2100421 RepID=A0A6J5KQE4_9CAUD|nr:hypothetical protein UFOVP48_18 [uncultured Caudovirales phage]